MTILFLAIAVVLVLLTYWQFRKWKNLNDLLKRKDDMTGVADGYISDLHIVRRRNRSFRWNNAVPVVTYTVNKKEYKVEIEEAEDRPGKYEIGDPCTVRYLPGKPEHCLVEEFEKKYKGARTGALIATILLGFFACNATFGTIGTFFAALFG